MWKKQLHHSLLQGLESFGRKSESFKSKILFGFSLSIAIGASLAAGVALFQIPSLKTSYSIRQFSPKNHPLIVESDKIRQTFSLNEFPGFLIVATLPEKSTKDWMDPSQIQTLKTVTENLKSLEGVTSVFSLSQVEGLFETENELTLGPIFNNLPQDQWRSYVLDQRLISTQLLTKDLRSTLITVEPAELSPDQLLALSQDITAEIQKVNPEIKVMVGGVPEIQSQFAHRLRGELELYLALCFLIFGCVFAFLIKGKGALSFVILNLLLGNGCALGTLAAFRIPFSVLLSTLPILLSIVIVSLSIHCFHRWAQELQKIGPDGEPASPWRRFKLSLHVLGDLALPNFLGSLTTAIGFAALTTSSIPVIREYGIVVACAVMAGWAMVHLTLAGFMWCISPRLHQKRELPSGWVLFPIEHAKWMIVIIGIASAGFTAVGTQIHFSSRLYDDLPSDDPARTTTEYIDRNFGGAVGYDLVLQSEEEGYFKDLRRSTALFQLVREISRLKGVGSVFSYTDLMNADALRQPEKLAETFFLFSLSSSNPMGQYITEDGRQTRLAIRFRDLTSDEIQNLRSEIVNKAQASFAGARVSENGLSVRAHTINQEVSRSLIYGFIDSLVLIGLFLIVVFRSLRWALVACFPNFIPPAVLIGCMVIFGTPVKPTVALIFSIALGLAFNNTVYFLGRLRKLCGAQTPTAAQLRQALLQEAYPCLSETTLMFCGFMIFLASGFQVHQTFGVYMLLAIFSGFVGDLIFLPAVLKIVPKTLSGRAQQDGRSEGPFDQNEMDPAHIAAGIGGALLAGALLFGLSSPQAQAAVDAEAKSVLEQVRKKVESKDDQAHVKMTITEANGQSKEREMTLATLRDDRFYAKVHILSPADVKGTGFLAHVSPDDEKHWIYVPSTKKVRRVMGGNKGAGILGSELTVEDLDSAALKSANISIKSKDPQKIILEVTPDKGTSPYSKVLTAISPKELVPLRTVYFKGNKQVKMVEFKDYQKSGNVLRARKIVVKNLENKRGTELRISDIKTNQGLDRGAFSQSSIEN